MQSFFAKRKTLLVSRGWTVSEFEDIEQRIINATTAMEMAEDLEESEADHKEEIAEIKANEFFTETQKQQMIAGLRKMRQEKRTRFINPTKPDWPAVRPYRSTLRELTDWIAGNIPNLPALP